MLVAVELHLVWMHTWLLRYGSVGSEEYSCRPLRIRSRKTWHAGLAFMILAMACWIRGFNPGNQLPYADHKLYARSMPIITPVGEG